MYMQLNLTQATDRAIAFSGLEKRLADVLYTKVRYGIIQQFLHRSCCGNIVRRGQRLESSLNVCQDLGH
jgi:hypothetical protein